MSAPSNLPSDSTDRNNNTVQAKLDNTNKTDSTSSASARSKSRRVTVSLPSAGHSLEDPIPFRRVPPVPWAPSSHEKQVAHHGATAVQALLRRLET
ncbi:hypothetical protein BGZ51_000190, partial [Haplosporangium sp. Z 767]